MPHPTSPSCQDISDLDITDQATSDQDTSDKLYTPEELSAYAAAQASTDAAAAPHDQSPVEPSPRPLAALRSGPPAPTAPLTVPLTGTLSGPPPARARGTHSAPEEAILPAREPSVSAAAPVLAAQAPGQRRLTTATDFLDRRADVAEPGPATWGWQGRVRRWSAGFITPRMSDVEQEYEQDRATLQRDFDGPRTIAFVNPKGGAAKTTGVLAAGFTLGTVRGGGVVAWDNNETRGTLGIRGNRSAHQNTTRELLADLDRFDDVSRSRVGDLAAFVRSQGDAHFDVLASDERPDVTGQIHAEDFQAIHGLMERFYRIILVDTGNNMRAENWLAAADAADLLVVTSTVREDTGYSGLWMLDALQDAGYENLRNKTVTVLSDPSPTVDPSLAQDLVDVYEQRTRHVFRVPYDPVLVAGGVVSYNQLSSATRMAWLRACAGMAEAL